MLDKTSSDGTTQSERDPNGLRNVRKFTTAWERVCVSPDTAAHMRGYQLWSRLFDGRHIFNIALDGAAPGPNDGGYASIDAVLKLKGFL